MFITFWTVLLNSELIFLALFFCRVVISVSTFFTLEPYLNSHLRSASYKKIFGGEGRI